MSKDKKEHTPLVHEELNGFDIKINTFGELETNTRIDQLNAFLNENTKDKKLKPKNNRSPKT